MAQNDNENEFEKKLIEPYEYLSNNPGKNMRSQLIKSLNIWLNVPIQKLNIINNVIDMLHNASLLIDDIEDESELRRGNPTAHIVFGTAMTINCANYVYFLALDQLLKINENENKNKNKNDCTIIQIFSDELLNLHKGQGMDIYWREESICPSQDHYIQMIKHKTGGLLRLAVKLMQEFSSNKENFVELVDMIGVHFQIRDDYINLKSQEYMKGKGYCEDITEGKFSFPIIHSIQNDNETKLFEILKQKTTDKKTLDFAVECIEKTDSFNYTLIHIIKLENLIRKEIERLGGNSHLIAIVDYLSQVYKDHSLIHP